MEFIYEQATGRFLQRDGETSIVIAYCYAGAPGFVNDPQSDHLAARGPLPKGRYVIRERPHPRFASPALYLAPVVLNDMHGRSGFYIHGDNSRGDRSASSGCIVMQYHERCLVARRAASASGGAFLTVVAGESNDN